MTTQIIAKHYFKDGKTTLEIITLEAGEMKETFSAVEIAELACDEVVTREYTGWEIKTTYAAVRAAAKMMNM